MTSLTGGPVTHKGCFRGHHPIQCRIQCWAA